MPKVPCFESTTGATPGCMNIPRLIQSVEYDRFGRDRRKLARLRNRGETGVNLFGCDAASMLSQPNGCSCLSRNAMS